MGELLFLFFWVESMGRKTIYTDAIADEICARLAEGEPLRSICSDAEMPNRSTVLKWVVDDLEGFSGRYARAREVGLDQLAEETLAISDTPVEGVRRESSPDGQKEVREDMLGHRRLQVDTRKWLLSKLAPKKYGDRAAVELTGANGGSMQHDHTVMPAGEFAEIARRIADEI